MGWKNIIEEIMAKNIPTMMKTFQHIQLRISANLKRYKKKSITMYAQHSHIHAKPKDKSQIFNAVTKKSSKKDLCKNIHSTFNPNC